MADHEAFFIAAQEGDYDTINNFICNGIDVDMPDPTSKLQWTALHLAAWYGHHQIVDSLCVAGCNVDLGDKNFDRAALHFAAANGNVEAVRVLLDYKCDINRQDSCNIKTTALHAASERGHNKVVEVLVGTNGCQLDLHDINQKSALHWAALGGQSDVINTLMSSGCNTLGKTGFHGSTPLVTAAKFGKLTAVQAILEHPCRKNTNKYEQDLENALLAAAKSGNYYVLNYLLEMISDEKRLSYNEIQDLVSQSVSEYLERRADVHNSSLYFNIIDRKIEAFSKCLEIIQQYSTISKKEKMIEHIKHLLSYIKFIKSRRKDLEKFGLERKKIYNDNAQYIIQIPVYEEEKYYLKFNKKNSDKILGKGGFGTVYEGVVKLMNGEQNKVAVKTTDITGKLKRDFNMFFDEAQKMVQLFHPNIVTFLGMYLEDSKLNLVTGLCKEDLQHYFIYNGLKYNRNPGSLDEENYLIYRDEKLDFILKVGIEIISGLKYLHEKLIIHCDMKLSNILLTYENVAQIADFGLAEFKGLHTGYVGTKRYSAPETFDVNPSYSTASDIFPFGLMLYEAWYGDFYFEIDKSFAKKGSDIAHQLKRNKRPQFKGNELSELFELMIQSWAQDPGIRPSCDECLDVLKSLRANLKIAGSTVPSPISDANFFPTFCDDFKSYMISEESGNSDLFSDVQNCPRFSKLSLSST